MPKELIPSKELEGAARYLLDDRVEVPEAEEFELWMAQDIREIEEVSEVSCLEEEDRKDYEQIVRSEGIQYVLLNDASTEGIDGYSSAYFLEEENGETTYGVIPMIFHDLEKGKISEANKLTTAAHFLNSEKMNVDSFAIGTDIEVSNRYSQLAEEVNREAELIDEPVKYLFNIESKRLILHEF